MPDKMLIEILAKRLIEPDCKVIDPPSLSTGATLLLAVTPCPPLSETTPYLVTPHSPEPALPPPL